MTTPPAGDPLKDAFRDQLLKNLNPNDPSLNDPALKPAQQP